MFIIKFLLNTKTSLSNILSILNKQRREFSDKCEILTSIPGIEKNCNNLYQAEYITPESIIYAYDQELLTIPEVGISFVKKLRERLGRV